jgi:hypothetical protein
LAQVGLLYLKVIHHQLLAALRHLHLLPQVLFLLAVEGLTVLALQEALVAVVGVVVLLLELRAVLVILLQYPVLLFKGMREAQELTD